MKISCRKPVNRFREVIQVPKQVSCAYISIELLKAASLESYVNPCSSDVVFFVNTHQWTTTTVIMLLLQFFLIRHLEQMLKHREKSEK